MKVDVIAEFTPYTAIGWVAEQVVTALHNANHDVHSVGLCVDGQWGCTVAPCVRATHAQGLRDDAVPVWVGPLTKAHEVPRRAIVVTGWESDRIPPEYALPLHRARAVLTWGRWAATTMQSTAKLHVPIVHFPLGVDTTVFCPQPGVLPKRTTFLTAGRTAHGYGRKGVDLVMLAFLHAFPSDREEVVLQVKVQPDCPLTHLRSGRIQVFAEWLAPQDMARWYRNGSAFVCASSGEGWGLHSHEALACGVPLIAPFYGGLTEFFVPEQNGWRVPHKLISAAALHKDAGRWAQPDFYALSKWMRYVYDNPAEALVFGAVGAQQVAALDTANMHKHIVQHIQHYGA